MTDFTFQTETTERRVTAGDLKDVVTAIHYRMFARDGEFTQDAYGAVRIGEPAADSFVAFDDVTKEQCKTWTFEAIAVEVNARRADDAEGDPATAASIEADMKAQLQIRIDEKKNPTVLPGVPAKWAAE